MKAEIISIGDELTSGQRLDTNSQWLSQRLGEIGIAVVCHVTVADDLEQNVEVYRQAVERADIVISTGGLGPTADDLTREVLARLVERPLELRAEALAHIERLFAYRQRPMPERNRVQAMFPQGSRVIDNPEGTAPGIALAVERNGRPASRVYALPGVPAEMHRMWQESVAPELVSCGGEGRVIRHRQIKCFGVGESDLEQMLPDLIRRGRTPSVGITVHDATITLRITATGRDDRECEQLFAPTVDTIRQCLGTLVFGEGDEELEHAVARLLVERSATLGTCEWGTGGRVADAIGSVDSARPQLLGSFVVPSPTAAQRLWGVETEHLSATGGNSPETARLLAEACRQRLGADYALAVSALPQLSLPGQQPGHAYYALATPRGVVEHAALFAGHSAILKSRCGKQALNLLRLELLGQHSR